MKSDRRYFGRGRVASLALLIMIIGGSCFSMEPHYVPFDYKVAGNLLKNTVDRKLVPCEFKSDGMTLTITKLDQFVMDWENSQFRLSFDFRARYNKSFIKLERAGKASVTGSGLMSAGEQKMGVKLLKINGIKLDGGNELIDSAARMILDKSLSGKAFWYGAPPSSYEELTKDNLSQLLQVALNQLLPQTFTNDGTKVTLNHVEELAFGSDAGMMQSRMAINGNYQKIFHFNFSGLIGVRVWVLVDPEQLAGKITIDQVTDLQLDKSPALLDGIIRRMVNAKLKGQTVEFSWR